MRSAIESWLEYVTTDWRRLNTAGQHEELVSKFWLEAKAAKLDAKLRASIAAGLNGVSAYRRSRHDMHPPDRMLRIPPAREAGLPEPRSALHRLGSGGSWFQRAARPLVPVLSPPTEVRDRRDPSAFTRRALMVLVPEFNT